MIQGNRRMELIPQQRRGKISSILLSSSFVFLISATRALAISTQVVVQKNHVPVVSSYDNQRYPMLLALVPQDSIPKNAIPLSMDNLQQYLKMAAVGTDATPETPEVDTMDEVKVPDHLPRPKPHDRPPPDLIHSRNESITHHHHGIDGIHLHDLAPVVEFIKTIIIADQAQDKQGGFTTNTGTVDGSAYETSTMNDQLVIISTVLGMSLFVVFISFRKQRKWKLKQRSMDHKKNSPFFTHNYIDDELKGKNNGNVLSKGGSNIWYNIRQGLLGSSSSKQQQYSDVYYGDPSLGSGSSHSDAASIYGYNTFSADSEYYDHRHPYSPVFSHGGWNSDSEKFDV
jgi:hypothetical protein